MRTITTILALCGSYWALVGIAGWWAVFGEIQVAESTPDLAKPLVTLVLLVSGYSVWWGWIFYSIKMRFPFVTIRTFWYVSLLHHIACIFYLIPMDVWGGGDDPWWVPLWTIGNVLIAAILLTRHPRNEKQAEQGGEGGTGSLQAL